MMTSLWQKNEGGATAAQKVEVEGSTQRQKGNSSENAIHGGLMSRGFHSPLPTVCTRNLSHANCIKYLPPLPWEVKMVSCLGHRQWLPTVDVHGKVLELSEVYVTRLFSKEFYIIIILNWKIYFNHFQTHNMYGFSYNIIITIKIEIW